MADEIKISGLPEKTTIAETDFLVGNVGTSDDATGRVTISALRTRLNNANQNITGNIEASGNIKAATLGGNGALITGVIAAGLGGSSSPGSLTLACNSDNSTPAAKVTLSKYTTDLVDIDETGVSPKTGIPYSHDDAAIPFDKDLDLQNKYLLQSQTIQDLQPFQALKGDGTSSEITVADNASYDFSDQDFQISFEIKRDGVPATSEGLFRKGTVPFIFADLFSDGTVRFRVADGVNDERIVSNNPICDGKWHKITLCADRDGLLYMFANGIKQTDTAPCPPLTLATAENLRLLNNNGTTPTSAEMRYFDIQNQVKSDSWNAAFSGNPLMAIDYADEGGSNVTLTSGTLIVNKRYRIDNYIVGDDFTNVGAASNVTGEVFVATGTTPTTWTNSSELRRLGATVVHNGRDLVVDSGGNVLFAKDSSGNGNHGSATNVKVANRSEQLTQTESEFVAALTCGTSGAVTLNTSFDTLRETKQGSIVHVSGEIKVLSVSSPLGNLILSGFTNKISAKTETSENISGSVTCQTLAAAATGSIGLNVISGTNTIGICDGFNGTGAVGNDFANHMQAGAILTFNFWYLTED